MYQKILIFLLVLFLSSCSTLIKQGYIKPKKQSGQYMKVISKRFSYSYRMNKRIDLKYSITLKINDLQSFVGNYLKIEYENPEEQNTFKTILIPITRFDKIINIKSDKFYGFKNMHTYLVKISIVNNNKADKILDYLEQYIRVDYIPYGYKNEL